MAEKLLSSTAGKHGTLKELYPGLKVSSLYKDPRLSLVSLEDVQSSHEYHRSINGAGFGSTASFNFQNSEMFIKGIALEITLNSGTYIFQSGWAYNIIDQITVMYPGEQRRTFSGESNFLQCMYEARHDDKQKEVIILGGGPVNDVNPPAPITGFAHLNIMNSSLDDKRKSQFFPIHLLNGNVEILIKFKRESEFFISGSTTISSVKVRYERASVMDPSHLKQKKHPYVVPYYTMVDVDYRFTGQGVNQSSIRLDALTEDGESLNILYKVNRDSDIGTNKNHLFSVPLSKIRCKLGDRDIIESSDNNFQDLTLLWNNREKLEYNINNTLQPFYNIPLSLSSYRDQLANNKYSVGANIEYDQIRLLFASEAVASTLHVQLYQRTLMTFHNGLLSFIK